MLKDHLIHENDTLKKTLKKTSGFFGKILCVIDKKKKLIGCLTAGDIRRAILSGFSINQNIKKIYNKNVSFIFKKELISKKIKYSNLNNKEINESIFYLPIVNDKMQVIDIQSIDRVMEQIENRKILKNNFKKLPKILIVGGAGYIGSVLCEKLLKLGYNIRVVDKLLYDESSIKKFKKNKKFELIVSDICDLNTQIHAVKNIDAVIFLAEIVGDPACNAKPEDALKTNYLSIASMSQLCSHIGISKFIYTSSCSVYGVDKNNKVLTETSQLNPISHYARMKIMSEKALLSNKNEIFKPSILRLGTVFGPSNRRRFDLVVNTMAKNAYYQKKINLHGGDQWRPNIHVEDVAEGIISILKSNSNKVGNQIFNLSSDISNYKIKDLALLAKKVFKKSSILVNKNQKDNRNYKVSSKKLYKATKFRATRSVESAYRSFYQFFKENNRFNPEKKIYSNVRIINEK